MCTSSETYKRHKCPPGFPHPVEVATAAAAATTASSKRRMIRLPKPYKTHRKKRNSRLSTDDTPTPVEPYTPIASETQRPRKSTANNEDAKRECEEWLAYWNQNGIMSSKEIREAKLAGREEPHA